MNFGSEGLGTRELVLGLDRAKLDREKEAIILTGVVDAPADWAYKVTMEVGDWTTVLRAATSPEAREFLSGHVSLGKILDMGRWMAKFILLLAIYRLKIIIGGNDKGQNASVTALQERPSVNAAHGGGDSAC